MTIRSPYPDVAIPDVLLPDFVLESALERGERVALVDGATGSRMTYEELWHAVHRVAAGFISLGLRPGDVVCLCLPNGPEFPIAFHGVLLAGGTVTTIGPLAAAPEMAFQLRHAGARFMLTSSVARDAALSATSEGGVEEVWIGGETEGDFFDFLPGNLAPPHPPAGPKGVAVLPYSSGTTGLPKGVMLTHRNLVANLCQLEPAEQLSVDDTLIAVLPFFHIYGMQVVMNLGLRSGATIVTLPRFDLGRFLSVIEKYRVTRASVVPPIVLALERHAIVDDYDLSSLDRVVSAAAPLGGENEAACSDRLGCPVVQGYGLTEAGPATHAVPFGGAHYAGSVGELLPGTVCRLVDTVTGSELGRGQTGELWVRGPQVMEGYLDDPAATAQILDADGWLHTGDLFHAADDGQFYVRDRVKELIKYKGFQVAPAQLEALLLCHPAVVDAAVVPSPDGDGGEVPKAFVVLAEDASSEDLMAYVAGRVAPYKRVRKVERIEAIPRSPAGKILRRVLIERERATRV